MSVTLLPDRFRMVLFDRDLILATVAEMVEQVGIDGDIVVDIDETVPTTIARLAALDPVHLEVQSGAIEDTRYPRTASPAQVADVVGRLLFEASDRLDPDFGAPPLDEELPLHHRAAWDIYCAGRVARLGNKPMRRRRLYHFRNRHSFTDVADTSFERLWAADGLPWAEVVDLSDRAHRMRASL